MNSKMNIASSVEFNAQFNTILLGLKVIHLKSIASSIENISLGAGQRSVIQSLQLFEHSTQKHVMLLTGEVGSGKTTICQEYLSLFYQQEVIRPEDYLPIYISLSKYKEVPHKFLKQHCIKHLSLSEEEYYLLCQQGRMLLILDDYEVIEQLDWLREYLKVEKERPSWERLKIVVVCKKIHLLIKQENYEAAFYPIDEDKLKVEWFQSIKMNILSDIDQTAIIQHYITKKNSEGEKEGLAKCDRNMYNIYQNKTPVIKELLCNSLMLIIFLKYLPEVLRKSNAENYRKNSITKKDVIEIYKMMTEKWIEYQIEKHSIEGKGLQQDIWELCTIISGVMSEYNPKKSKITSKELVKIISYGVDIERVIRALQLSPLRYDREIGLGFMNRFLQAYFEQIHNYKEKLSENTEGLFRLQVKILRETKEIDWEDNLLNSTVLSERVVNEIAYKIKEGDVYWIDRCKSYIRKSAESEAYAMASVNSGTILVRGGVNLSREIFHNVKLSAWDRVQGKQVGANLSGGYFDETNFTGANLTGVNFNQAWLRKTEMQSCVLSEVDFGEYLLQHDDAVNSIVYRTDLNRLVTASGNKIILWNIETRECIKEFIGHRGRVTSVSMSLDGKTIASGSEDKTVKLWDVLSGNNVATLEGHSGCVNSIHISSDGMFVVSGSDDKTIRIWDVDKKINVKELKGHTRKVMCVSLSMDANFMVSGSEDTTVRFWDMKNNTCRVLYRHDNVVTTVCISADCKTVISGSKDNTVRFLMFGNPEVRILGKHHGSVRCVFLSTDSKKAVSVGGNNNELIWDIVSGVSVEYQGHEDRITSVQFSEDCKTIATGSLDKTVRIHPVEKNKNILSMGHENWVRCVHLSLSSRYILSIGHHDTTVMIWDMINGYQSKMLIEFENKVLSTKLIENDSKIISCDDNGIVSLHYINGKNPTILSEMGCKITAVYISEDAVNVVTGCDDKTVRLSGINGEKAKVLFENDHIITNIYISSNSKKVLVGDNNGVVKICNLDGTNLNTLFKQGGRISSIDMSADNSIGVSASYDSTLYLLNFESYRLDILEGHKNKVMCVNLYKNGKYIISGSLDKTIRVWDRDELNKHMIFYFNSGVDCFSINDQGLVSIGFKDGAVQLWKLSDNCRNWQFLWSSAYPNFALNLHGCNVKFSSGLSIINRQILYQRGAIVDGSPILSTQERQVEQYFGNTLYAGKEDDKKENTCSENISLNRSSKIKLIENFESNSQFNKIYLHLKIIHLKSIASSIENISLGAGQRSVIQSLQLFEHSSQKHMLLLTGEVGSGKTTICHEYLSLFYQRETIRPDDYLPIYISLSKYKEDPIKFIKRHCLENLSLSEEDYNVLCQQGRMLLILDDYEVIEHLDWLREYLRVEKERPNWERLKIIVVCREVHLIIKQENYESAFYPIDEDKVKVGWIQALKVDLLSELDQEIVIKHYVTRKGTACWIEASYNLYRAVVPGIKELLSNFQMLTIFLKYMPVLLEEPSENKVRTKSITKGEVILIYEMMLERWKEMEVEKQLIKSNEYIQEVGSDIKEVCEVVAGVMAEYDPKKNTLSRGEIIKIISEGRDTKRVEFAMQISPLRYNKDSGLRFINGVLLAYFEKLYNQRKSLKGAKRNLFRTDIKMLREIDENDCENNLLNSTILSERVVNEIAFKIKEGDIYWVKRCKGYIKNSTESEAYAMASVNSGTILVRGEVNLSGEDFRGVKLSAFDKLARDRVGANLSGGYFDSTNFSMLDHSLTDLRHVNFTQAWLANANLQGCRLRDVEFGELPSLKFQKTISEISILNKKTLIVASGMLIHFVDSSSGRILHESTDHKKDINSISVSRVKNIFVSVDSDHSVNGVSTLIVWDIESKQPIHILSFKLIKLFKVKISEDGNNILFSTGSNQSVHLYSYDSLQNKFIENMKHFENDSYVYAVYINSDGKLIAWGTRNIVKLMINQKHIVELIGLLNHPLAIDMSSCGTYLAAGGLDGLIIIWNIKNKRGIHRKLNTEAQLRDQVLDLKFMLAPNANGSNRTIYIVAGLDTGRVKIWDIETGSLVKSISHSQRVTSIEYSEWDNIIISGDWTGLVKFSKHGPDSLGNKIFDVIVKSYSNLFVVRDGKYIYAGEFENDNGGLNIYSWSMFTGSKQILRTLNWASVSRVCFSNDGKYAVWISGDSTLVKYNIINNDFNLIKLSDKCKPSDLKCNHSLLISSNYDCTKVIIGTDSLIMFDYLTIGLRIWHDIFTSDSSIAQIKISANGNFIYAGSRRGQLSVIDIYKDKIYKLPKSHRDLVKCMNIAMNEIYFVSGCWNGTVHVYNLVDGEISFWQAHEKEVTDVAILNTDFIATCSTDQKIKIWDYSSNLLVRTIHLPYPVISMAYFIDEMKLIVSCNKGNLYLFSSICECFKDWLLLWATNKENTKLHLENSIVSSPDILDKDKDLMCGYGATVNNDSLTDVGGVVLSEVGKRTGSPIYCAYHKKTGEKKLDETHVESIPSISEVTSNK